MNLIVACGLHKEIGKGNDLIWHIKDDMRLFKELTLGKTVVMGRKTLESLPNGKPLKNRNNIIFRNMSKHTFMSFIPKIFRHSTRRFRNTSITYTSTIC